MWYRAQILRSLQIWQISRGSGDDRLKISEKSQALEPSELSVVWAGADWNGCVNAATWDVEASGNKSSRRCSGQEDHSPAIVFAGQVCLEIETFDSLSRRPYSFSNGAWRCSLLNSETRSAAVEAAVKNDAHFRRFQRQLETGQTS